MLTAFRRSCTPVNCYRRRILKLSVHLGRKQEQVQATARVIEEPSAVFPELGGFHAAEDGSAHVDSDRAHH